MIQTEAECLAQAERPASKLAFSVLVSPSTGGLLSGIVCLRLPRLNATQFRFRSNCKVSLIFFTRKTTRTHASLVQVILGQAGFCVSVTGDSSEVLDLLATTPFDALLLDNWMPKISGIELCRVIRSSDQKLPIFFCSGAATDADRKAALSAGAQSYFIKPFDPDELTTTLRAVLKTSHSGPQ